MTKYLADMTPDERFEGSNRAYEEFKRKLGRDEPNDQDLAVMRAKDISWWEHLWRMYCKESVAGMTDAERALASNPALVAQIVKAIEKPEMRRRRERPVRHDGGLRCRCLPGCGCRHSDQALQE